MTTQRNPENTRMKLLIAAFQEIHRNGYQGMRIDQVLQNTNLKKGAMYHHFPSKQALGYAVLEELIQQKITEQWIDPLKDFDNPIDGINRLFIEVGNIWSDEFFSLGCPLNNLAQEMSPIDQGFSERIKIFFNNWHKTIAEALKKGQQMGSVDPSINTHDSAMFILTVIEGAFGMTKNHQNKEVYDICSRELKRYLDTLKHPGSE